MSQKALDELVVSDGIFVFDKNCVPKLQEIGLQDLEVID